MKLDLTRFFQICNVSKTLVVGKAEDRQYFIDFSQVRGAMIIEELKLTITHLAPEDPTWQLLKELSKTKNITGYEKYNILIPDLLVFE
jgi:hypothetical protein